MIQSAHNRLSLSLGVCADADTPNESSFVFSLLALHSEDRPRLQHHRHLERFFEKTKFEAIKNVVEANDHLKAVGR